MILHIHRIGSNVLIRISRIFNEDLALTLVCFRHTRCCCQLSYFVKKACHCYLFNEYLAPFIIGLYSDFLFVKSVVTQCIFAEFLTFALFRIKFGFAVDIKMICQCRYIDNQLHSKHNEF